MVRHLFYATAFVSAFLLLATVILWPLSHYKYLSFSYMHRTGTTFALSVANGRLFLTYQEDLGPSSRRGRFDFQTNTITNNDDWSYRTWNTSWNDGVWFEGLGIFLDHFPGPLRVEELLIPFSYLTVLFATLPVVAWRNHRRRRAGVGSFEVEMAAEPKR